MRKLIGFGFIITMLCWSQASTIGADIYTWTDENGVKHFSHEPPPDNSDVEQRDEYKTDRVLQERLDKKRSRKQDEMTGKVPVGSDERVTKNPGKVFIFTKAKHRKCNKVIGFFKEYNITFTEYNIDKDIEAKRRFEALRGKSVPYTFVGTRKFYGFNRGLLINLFGIKNPTGAKIRHIPSSKTK